MNQQEILKKIGGIIAELKDQYSYLNAAENGFNDLELELFMANAHFLTDHIGILQKINHQLIPASLPVAKQVLQIQETPPKSQIPDYFAAQDLLSIEEPVQFKNTIPEIIEPFLTEILPLKEVIILPEVMPKDEVVLPQETIVLPETFPQTEPAESVKTDASFIDQKSVPEPDLREESFGLRAETTEHNTVRPETVSLNINLESSDFSISSGSETKTTAEPVVLTLNERIAAQKGLDQPKTETANKTAQDLHAMISLNDKLLFVKELFNGYNLAYAEAINILNRYVNFEQAESFLNQNYAVKNNWKDKPVTTEKLMDLLRKKFV